MPVMPAWALKPETGSFGVVLCFGDSISQVDIIVKHYFHKWRNMSLTFSFTCGKILNHGHANLFRQ